MQVNHWKYWPRKRLTLNFPLLCRIPNTISITYAYNRVSCSVFHITVKVSIFSHFWIHALLQSSIGGYYIGLTSHHGSACCFLCCHIYGVIIWQSLSTAYLLTWHYTLFLFYRFCLLVLCVLSLFIITGSILS